MSFDQALDKLSEKLSSRLLVREERGFQKGAQCAPWPQELKKRLARIALIDLGSPEDKFQPGLSSTLRVAADRFLY